MSSAIDSPIHFVVLVQEKYAINTFPLLSVGCSGFGWGFGFSVIGSSLIGSLFSIEHEAHAVSDIMVIINGIIRCFFIS